VGFSVGSATLSIASLMEVMDAQQKIRENAANLAQLTTSVTSTANLTVAQSTVAAGTSEGDVLDQNADEQYASLASSLGQVGFGFSGVGATARASRFSTKMDNLASNESFNKPAAASVTVGPLRPNQKDPSTPDGKLAIKYANLLKEAKSGGKGISLSDYKKIVNGGGKDFNLKRLTNPNATNNDTDAVTLEHVFASESDSDELSKMRVGLGIAKTDARKSVDQEHTRIQNYVQIGNGVSSSFSAGFTAQNKMTEAQDTRDKAAQNMESQLAQADASFLGNALKSQNDQSDQANNAANQGLQTIAQIVQVDTRG